MNDSTKPLSKVIRIDESDIRGRLDEMVRGTVEETLNSMLDAEADEMCNAQRYEHSPDRIDTRAGSYSRKLHTKAGEVEVKVPKLRKEQFNHAIPITPLGQSCRIWNGFSNPQPRPFGQERTFGRRVGRTGQRFGRAAP